MTYKFMLPDLGEGIAEARVGEWLAELNDTVRVDQPLVAVETDKAIMEITSPVAGKVIRRGAEAQQTIKVGDLLVEFETEDAAPATEPTIPSGSGGAASEGGKSPGPGPAPARAARRVMASPAVRRYAKERGIDLQNVAAAVDFRRVTRADVDQFLSEGMPSKPADPEPAAVRSAGQAQARREPLSSVRRAIAEKMSRSWTSIPPAVDFREIEMTRLLEFRERVNSMKDAPGKVSIYGVIMKAAALALRRHPLFNATFDEESNEVVYHPEIAICVPVATDHGLYVPAIGNADRLTVFELSEKIRDLSARGAARELTPAEQRGGTFTVNNVGALNQISASLPFPLINWPQVAIFGFGRITDRVFAENGQAVIRPAIHATMLADHRIADGAEVAAFTGDLVSFLLNPETMAAVV